jgi:signal transduction histidine kinase/CheY-like chemotaxis protein
VVAAIVTWWVVLTQQSRQVAQEESNRQTQALNEQAQTLNAQALTLQQEIDSHRRTDEALQQARRVADLANQAKTRYISAISHELRTPLNSIIGYAQLLDEDEGVPPHRKQAVSVIKRGGDHLLSLIEGTLDIARIEGGKLTLEVAPMRFREFVDELVRMFELQASNKGLRFVFEEIGSLPEAVRTDEKRMRQILINVLGNAVKFTGLGQVTFRVGHQREMALFEIEDTGPGIAPAEIERIFEPFARGSAVGSSGAHGGAQGGALGGISASSSGTGLGLTIGKMLTDLMGGEMTVVSPPRALAAQAAAATELAGQSGRTGTLFRIRLFLPEVRADTVARVLRPPARIGYEGARRSVLVVDNEEVDRELLVKVLTPLGFDVRTAASGHACLAVLKESRPDAILMDLAMPGIDGWETLRRMRAQGLSDAPVAIVSANAFDKGLDNDVGIRSTDFVLKPVRKAELLDWLGRALKLHWTEAPTPIGGDSSAMNVANAAGSGPVDIATFVWPDAARLRALADLIEIGYFRGILRLLDVIEVEQPACRDFVVHLRGLARQFQLDAMTATLKKAP